MKIVSILNAADQSGTFGPLIEVAENREDTSEYGDVGSERPSALMESYS